MLAALATVISLATTISLVGPAAAQLYRWTDAHNTTFYTTDRAGIPPAYRDSAVDIGSPTPGPVQPAAPPPTPGVTIPYTGGPLIVSALLNGTPLRLLVDTGADRTLISPTAMGRAGFDLRQGTPTRIRGVTGDAVATLVLVPRLDVAGASVGPVGVVVHAIPGQNSVDGLLGRDVLDAFTVTVDAATQRATLTPR